MNYAAIKSYDVANGPGVRVSLFVSGCTHRCKGCFNAEAWDFNYGEPFTPQVEEQIRALGLDGSVRLLGNRRDVPDLLQAMDLFLFPSLHEGLPVSVVEAQAAGLPVLMSAAVTDEVCVTGARIARLSLDEPPERWAERALVLAGLERIDTAGMVAENGFDLRRNAARLVELYRTR